MHTVHINQPQKQTNKQTNKKKKKTSKSLYIYPDKKKSHTEIWISDECYKNSVYNNFCVFCKNLNLETENIFKHLTPLIMASSETKEKNVSNIQ